MKVNRSIALTAVGLVGLALVLSGCRSTPEASTASVPGITEEACPDAVNEDNGCIYLGAITDLTGPFSPVAVPVSDAQIAFWNKVNEDGGVGGYDVNIKDYLRDAEFNPELHNTAYQEIRKDILALGETIGAVQTLTIIDDMIADDVIGAPVSFNSAWEFETNILESGASYCFMAMNGTDWAIDEFDVSQKIMSVGYPGDYGGDAGAGVKASAEAHGIEYIAVETPSGADNQAGAIAEILREQPDLVFVNTAPTELATIIGGAVGQGFGGQFLGSYPSWNQALLETPVAPILEERYHQMSPWADWSAETEGHEAMREAVGDVMPNDGYVAGWAWSYPLLAVLQNAADDGPLTREALVKAAEELESVDYQGILPDAAGNKTGDANDFTFRENVILGLDSSAPTGMKVVEDFYVGSTTAEYDLSQPCYSLR